MAVRGSGRRGGGDGPVPGKVKRGEASSWLVPLSAADVRALDLNAEHLGVSVQTLMSNAGSAVADVVQRRYPEGTIGVLCGLGNNGGDGLVAATRLHAAGRKVHVLLAGRPNDLKTEAAQHAYAEAEAAGVRIQSFTDPNLDDLLDSIDLAIDALLGVGVSGALRPPYDRIVEALAGSEIPVVAVDVPTGHTNDQAGGLHAVCTVTFHGEKEAMEKNVCGEIVVVPIGIPDAAVTDVGPGDLVARYPRSRATARKGQHGRVLLVGGGPFTGAPLLAARGAFATGIDLLHAALPEPAVTPVRVQLPEAIVVPLAGERLLPEHVTDITDHFERNDVLLIGPGLGDHADTVAAARSLIGSALDASLGVVVDADGLRAVERTHLAHPQLIVTPHGGEFQALTGVDVGGLDEHLRLGAIEDKVPDDGATVLLKGPVDVIAGGGRHVWNRNHHEVMTTGGTGDVLAGCVAALLARGAAPFDAARVAAWLNGEAGQRAFEDLGYGVRASDVAERINEVLGDWFGAEA